jgi:putative membrane protein
MILPGISCSFILLILGKYQYIMERISELTTGVNVGQNIMIMGVFMIGAVVGILGFSKLLRWVLSRWHKETLIVLAGFIIGSLVKVWPWSNGEAIVRSQFPELAAMEDALPAEIISQHISRADMHIGGAVIFAIIGFSLVTAIEIAGKLIAKKNQA